MCGIVCAQGKPLFHVFSLSRWNLIELTTWAKQQETPAPTFVIWKLFSAQTFLTLGVLREATVLTALVLHISHCISHLQSLFNVCHRFAGLADVISWDLDSLLRDCRSSAGALCPSRRPT